MSHYVLRPGRSEDFPYVTETWLRHGQKSWPSGPGYHRAVKSVVRAILAKPTTVLRVATVPDDLDAILGFAVTETSPVMTVYFVYVRSGSRDLGIATELLGDTKGKVVNYTHYLSPSCPPGVKIPKDWIYAFYNNF